MQRALRCVLYAGLVAGTVDIAAAAAINRVGFGVILRAVASGLLGHAAFQGDSWVAALGMVLQWAMSIIIAALYVLAGLKLPILFRRWILCGALYGVVVFFVMNYVVVPLSAVGHVPHFKPASFVENLLAMLLFGLIIASIAHHFSMGGQRRVAAA
jgi:FtsH-binding integral membrane protein